LEFWGKERKWLGLFLDIVCVSKLLEGGGSGCVTVDERVEGRGGGGCVKLKVKEMKNVLLWLIFGAQWLMGGRRRPRLGLLIFFHF
jgi:hypothetical protein